MVKYIAYILSLVVTTFVAVISLEAQNSTSSPYSLYGVGVLTPQEDATSMAMGHSGIALAPNDWLDVANPAAVNNLDTLTFYFTAQMKLFYARESTEHDHQSVYSANVDGLAFGFRGTKWWGACIGYAPYSTVGYHMTDNEQYISGTNTKYSIRYTGSGGLSRAFFNNAFTLFDHLTLGISAGAIWGSITKVETALFSQSIGGEDIYNTKKYTMNNWFIEYGMQFNFNIGENNKFRFGAVYNRKTSLKSSYDHIVSNDVSNQLFFDDVTPLKADFTVPESYGAGISYQRKRFTVTCDAKYNKWGDLANSKFSETARFVDNWSIGGGAEWAFGNYNDIFIKRIKLRLGYAFETSYLSLGGRNVDHYKTDVVTWKDKDGVVHTNNVTIPIMNEKNSELDSYAITAGITIPMGRWSNAIVIGYEYRNHGTENMGMVKERFQNFKLAINIRETWFEKRKFE
ncbi:MAG: hypothetical protein HUJ96_10300 [Marinilabiliaceae bacterium]|nr:hypothetical protein [Marinilabiliaceae bacterium]